MSSEQTGTTTWARSEFLSRWKTYCYAVIDSLPAMSDDATIPSPKAILDAQDKAWMQPYRAQLTLRLDALIEAGAIEGGPLVIRPTDDPHPSAVVYRQMAYGLGEHALLDIVSGLWHFVDETGLAIMLYLEGNIPDSQPDEFSSPLAALIEGWLQWPQETKPSDVPTFPFFLTQQDNERRQNRYPLAAHFEQREGQKMVIPGFESEREVGIYLPEELYRLAEREGARRGVVSLAQRGLIFGLLRTPAERAASPTGYWFRVPGKDYIAVTHQANKRALRPAEWLPALRGMRDILNTFDLPYCDADGKARSFTPVAIMDYPHDADGKIDFVTRVPEGYGGTGVRISPRLWEFTSRTQVFYLMLSAPFLYDQPGITWRPRKGGGVSHFRDVEAYPVITRSMLANMANPFAVGRVRRRLEQNAFDLAEEVARLTGAFQIAKRKDTRILLPPRDLVNLDKSAKAKGFAIVRHEPGP